MHQANNSSQEYRDSHPLLLNYEQSAEALIVDLSQFANSLSSAAEYYFQHAKKLYLDNLALCRRVANLE
jgi:hypothetical protein